MGIALPKNRIWTEQIFNYIPFKSENLAFQMALRFIFLFSIWLTGLLAYSIDGLMYDYILNFEIYPVFFGTGLIVLFGSYMIQKSLPPTISSFKTLIDLDDLSYQLFVERVKRYSYSFIPSTLIALLLILSLTNVHSLIQLIIINGPSIHSIWEIFFISINYLLTGTGIWLGVSIWLSIFLISRQPLKVELTSGLIENFKGLSMQALWFSLFYFIAISIGVATDVVGNPSFSIIEIVFSPMFIFIVIGIFFVLFPFFNIHRTLLMLKQRELGKIDIEYEDVRLQLDEALHHPKEEKAKLIAIIGRLLSLQIKERSIEEAPEWPIDIGFISSFSA